MENPDPQNHVVFLKTHKTGGSTIQNILRRYAFKHNITVGLPKNKHIFGYPNMKKFNRTMVLPLPNGRKVGMLANHMVFHYGEISAIVPSDSFYLTILRDPATQFESAFQYYNAHVKSFSKTDFQTWINNPREYFVGPEDGYFWFYAKNGMTFDLGFDNLNESDAYIEEMIAEMDKIFDFVIITEYLDISLLLLRDLLHWSMNDIVSLKLNSRKQSSVEKIDSKQQEKIRDWNRADTALYKHYEKVLWRRVQKYGKDRLGRELDKYRMIKKEWETTCVEPEKSTNQDLKDGKFKVFNPHGVVIEQYQIREESKNNDTCVAMILPELKWDAKLWEYFYRDD